jgi:hypothetical protein
VPSDDDDPPSQAVERLTPLQIIAPQIRAAVVWLTNLPGGDIASAAFARSFVETGTAEEM